MRQAPQSNAEAGRIVLFFVIPSSLVELIFLYLHQISYTYHVRWRVAVEKNWLRSGLTMMTRILWLNKMKKNLIPKVEHQTCAIFGLRRDDDDEHTKRKRFTQGEEQAITQWLATNVRDPRKIQKTNREERKQRRNKKWMHKVGRIRCPK